MCLRCDGYSHEQVMLALDLTIRTHGWQLNQITGANPWSYTIGLTESYDHPELMIVGLTLEHQNSVIRRIVGPIETTGRIDESDLAAAGVTLVEVHANHLRGDWFCTWWNRYGHPPPNGTYLQVVPPDDWFCECHQHSMPHFELPGPIRFENRATRRRRGRS